MNVSSAAFQIGQMFVIEAAKQQQQQLCKSFASACTKM